MSKDPEFHLFSLLHGASFGADPHPIAEIPSPVASTLGWKTRTVFLTRSAAQKIRHHPMHGMDAKTGLQLPMVIRNGDYYQTRNRGTPLQVEVVLHEPDNPKKAYFLVLARDMEDRGIFLRTFYFSGQMSRGKMKKARVLFKQSTINYFKRDV